MNWPTTLVPYHRSPEFDEESVPENLLQKHTTKDGVWAMVRVLEGDMRFVDLDSGQETPVNPKKPAFIEPGQAHRIEVDGPVRFYVEFFKDASA